MNRQLLPLLLSLIAIPLVMASLLGCSFLSSSSINPDIPSMLERSSAVFLDGALLLSSAEIPNSNVLVVAGMNIDGVGVISEVSLNDGAILWQAGIPDLMYISGVKVRDGKYYIVGTEIVAPNSHLYFGAIDPRSNSITFQKFRNSPSSASRNLLYDDSGIYIIGVDDYKQVISKFNFNGELLWSKVLGLTQDTYFSDAILLNGKLIVVSDLYLLSVNASNGDLLASMKLSLSSSSIGGVTTDGENIYVMVNIDSESSNDIIIFKLSGDLSRVIWAKKLTVASLEGYYGYSLGYVDGKLVLQIHGFTPRRVHLDPFVEAQALELAELNASTGELISAKKLELSNTYYLPAVNTFSSFRGTLTSLISYGNTSPKALILNSNDFNEALNLPCLDTSAEDSISVRAMIALALLLLQSHTLTMI